MSPFKARRPRVARTTGQTKNLSFQDNGASKRITPPSVHPGVVRDFETLWTMSQEQYKERIQWARHVVGQYAPVLQ